MKEKAEKKICQVRIKETSESDSSLKHRNSKDDIKTEVSEQSQDKSTGDLNVVLMVSGVKMA